MTIDEAIKRLHAAKADWPVNDDEEYSKALQLGIEALEKVTIRRPTLSWKFEPLLPSETEKLIDSPVTCSKCLITKEQRIRIGTLVMNTGLIKEAKEYMFDRFNVHSTKDLTRDQADILIGKIEADLCHIP